MKRAIFILIILTISFRAACQEYYREVGITGGASLNYFKVKIWASSGNYEGREPIAGFQTGFFFNGKPFPKTKNILSVKTSLGCETKGGTIFVTRNSPAGKVEYKFTEREVALAVYIVAQASFGNHIQYFINTGNLFSPFITNGAIIQFDYGFTFGTGVSFPLKERWKLILESRYNLGLVSWRFENQDRVMRNRSAALLLGLAYRFHGKKKPESLTK